MHNRGRHTLQGVRTGHSRGDTSRVVRRCYEPLFDDWQAVAGEQTPNLVRAQPARLVIAARQGVVRANVGELADAPCRCRAPRAVAHGVAQGICRVLRVRVGRDREPLPAQGGTRLVGRHEHARDRDRPGQASRRSVDRVRENARRRRQRWTGDDDERVDRRIRPDDLDRLGVLGRGG